MKVSRSLGVDSSCLFVTGHLAVTILRISIEQFRPLLIKHETDFIKNGAANDYYMNRSYERRTFAALNLGYSVSNTFIVLDGYWPTQYVVPSLLSAKATSNTKSGLSSSVTIKESEYVCVPAKSYKVLDYYDINPSLEITCDRNLVAMNENFSK